MQHDARQAEIRRLESAFWQSLVDPAQYTKMLDDPKHGLLEYSLSDMDVLFPSDDVAIATYRAHQKVDHGGREVEQDVVDSSTWVRMDGGWRCVAHTETETNPPAM